MNWHINKWFLLGLLSTIWGSSYILMKKGLVVFTPAEVAMLRIVVGSVFLLPFVLPQLTKLSFYQYQFLGLYGFLGTLIPAFLVAKAQMKIPSGINGVLNSLTPVFVLLVGNVFFKRKFTSNELIGAVLGILGSLSLMFFESANKIGRFNFYAVLPVVVCFLYGVSTNLAKFRLQDVPARTIASVSLLLAGTIASLVLLSQTDFIIKLRTVQGAYQAVGCILLLGIFGLGVAQIIFTFLIQQVSPVFASTTSFLVPVVALLWGWYDQEVLVWQHYIGISVILLGVYFINQYTPIKKTT
jgi:drug/metabolite transporter (DMT)-like permease